MTDEMTIKDITKTYGISRRTIQGYESCQLIKPSKKSPRGHLIYDDRTVRKMVFIRFCQELGFSLKEIKSIINLNSSELAIKLADKSNEVQENINIYRTLKNKAEQIVDVLSSTEDFDVLIHQIITGGKE